MNIAYIRVSSIEQHSERQEDAIAKCNIDKWFSEKVSAKDTNRKELQNLLDFAREGDTIYVLDFSRLARSTKDLLDIVERLQSKGVNLVSLKEQIDTATPQGKLMLTMLGAIAEFERTNMLERQREGIAIAKARGAYKGRKRIGYPDNWEEIYSQYKSRELTGTKAIELLGLTRNVFYNLKREYENKAVQEAKNPVDKTA